MVLSDADKREIADMLNAFSDRMTTGQQSRPVERFVYDYTTQQVIPAVGSSAQAFTERMTTGRQVMTGPEMVLETALVPSKRKKAMTKFNKAVKEGMKIVKKSKSYGKTGTINNPKNAFKAVTKAVSKANKGLKASKGVLGKVGRKAASILKKRGVKKGRGRRGGALSYRSPR